MQALNQWGGSWAVPEAAAPSFGAPAADPFGPPPVDRFGESGADRFGPPPASRATPVLGDVDLPSAPAPFGFPTPPQNSGRSGLLIGGAVLAALAVVGGLVFWFLSRPSSPDAETAAETTDSETAEVTTTTTTEAPTTAAAVRDPGAEAQLLRTLPAGFPPGACRPVNPETGGTVAAVDCGKNLDPGGPAGSTFVVAADQDALSAVLTDAIRPADIVVCPGNIQSPGPWRRNAKPDQVAGTLVCGMQGNVPTVAWSDLDRKVVSVVRADPPGPGLDQLYQWWASHS